MNKLLSDRRLFISWYAITGLFILAGMFGKEVALAIGPYVMGIVSAVAAANAWEKKGKPNEPTT